MSNYYSKLKKEFGGAAKIPKGWRLVRMGEMVDENCKLFVFSRKEWLNDYAWGQRRNDGWDYTSCYIKRK